MLQSIRGKLESWVVLGLLALLIVSFAVWGIGDVFRGGSSDALARVGKDDISASDFTAQFNRILRNQQQENPQMTAAKAIAGGADKQVLAFLVQQESLKQAMRNFGITTSGKHVAAAIQSSPAFQMAGKFSQQQYEAVLAENSLTQADFQESMRIDLARNQLMVATSAGVRAPEKLAQAYARLLLEQRIGTLALVPPTAVTGIAAPDDKTLAAFHAAAKDRYMAPEYRRFRYALLTTDNLLDRAKVTQADITQYLADHADEFGSSETRTIEQVIAQDEATARAIAQRVGKGESFAAVAKALADYSEADLTVGDRTRKAMAEEFGEAAAAAVFALPKGGITKPVQSDFGWHVLRVTAIKSATTVPAAQARAKAEAAVRREKAGNMLYDLTGKIEDDLAGGRPLDEIAAEQKLALADSGLVSAKGLTPEGKSWAGGTQGSAILKQAFRQPAGGDAVAAELEREVFVLLQPGEIRAAALRPLDSVRALVLADYLAAERTKRAQAIARELAAGTGDLAAQAKARNLPVRSGMALSRAQIMASGQPAPEAIGLFFSQAKGKRGFAPAAGGGFAVVQVDDIRPVPVEAAAGLVSQIQQSLNQQMADELQQSTLSAIQNEIGWKVNDKALAKLSASLKGSD